MKIVGIFGILVLLTVLGATYRGNRDDFHERVLCLLTVAVLLIIYGFGLPK